MSRKSNGSPTVITSSEMSVYLTDARRFGVSLLFMGASCASAGRIFRNEQRGPPGTPSSAQSDVDRPTSAPSPHLTPRWREPDSESSVPRNRRPFQRQYRHIWAHGAWRRGLRRYSRSSPHSQPPGSREARIGGQFFEPSSWPETTGATSRIKHSIESRSWSRLRLPWKLI